MATATYTVRTPIGTCLPLRRLGLPREKSHFLFTTDRISNGFELPKFPEEVPSKCLITSENERKIQFCISLISSKKFSCVWKHWRRRTNRGLSSQSAWQTSFSTYQKISYISCECDESDFSRYISNRINKFEEISEKLVIQNL